MCGRSFNGHLVRKSHSGLLTEKFKPKFSVHFTSEYKALFNCLNRNKKIWIRKSSSQQTAQNKKILCQWKPLNKRSYINLKKKGLRLLPRGSSLSVSTGAAVVSSRNL